MWVGGGLVAVGGAAALGGAVASGAGLVALVPAFNLLNSAFLVWHARGHNITIAHPDGDWFVPYGNPRLIPGDRDGCDWGIEVGYVRRLVEPTLTFKSWLRSPNSNEQGRVRLNGEPARNALAKLLPRTNVGGAPKARVQEAVSLIDAAGGSEGVMSWAIAQRSQWASKQVFGDNGDLGYIPSAARLAIEMAVHEERERLALLGELAELERAWAQAEEVARIADGLLVPADTAARLAAMRKNG